MGVGALGVWVTGVLSNQEENSINFYFIMVPLKKVVEYGTPKPRLWVIWRLGVQVFDAIRLCGANLLFKVQTLNPVEGFRGFRSFGSGVQDLGLGCLGVLDGLGLLVVSLLVSTRVAVLRHYMPMCDVPMLKPLAKANFPLLMIVRPLLPNSLRSKP